MHVPRELKRAISTVLTVPLFATSLQAQKVGAVRGWFSSPDCASGTVDGAIRKDTEDNTERRAYTFEERASRIADDLPPGRAKELAMSLGRMLSHRERLKYSCKDNLAGEYIVTYPEGLGTKDVSESKSVKFRLRLANLAEPEVKFSVKRTQIAGEERFLYSYIISNKADARASIIGWQIVTDGEDSSLEINHPEWGFVPAESLIHRPAVAPQAALFDGYSGPELRRLAPPGRYAGWWAPVGGRLRPGEEAGSFLVTSEFRPGWTTAFFYGSSSTGVPGGLPSQVVEEYAFLNRTENKTSVVLVIGPMFGPSSSLGAIAVNWDLGIRQLVSHGWLSGDSPYVAELSKALGSVRQGESESLAEVESSPAPGLEALLDRILQLTF